MSAETGEKVVARVQQMKESECLREEEGGEGLSEAERRDSLVEISRVAGVEIGLARRHLNLKKLKLRMVMMIELEIGTETKGGERR